MPGRPHLQVCGGGHGAGRWEGGRQQSGRSGRPERDACARQRHAHCWPAKKQAQPTCCPILMTWCLCRLISGVSSVSCGSSDCGHMGCAHGKRHIGQRVAAERSAGADAGGCRMRIQNPAVQVASAAQPPPDMQNSLLAAATGSPQEAAATGGLAGPTTPQPAAWRGSTHRVQQLGVVQEGQGGGGVDVQIILVQADGHVAGVAVGCGRGGHREQSAQHCSRLRRGRQGTPWHGMTRRGG